MALKSHWMYIILVVFCYSLRTLGIQLTTSRTNATLEEPYTFTCSVYTRAVQFELNVKIECIMGNKYSNGTCALDESCNSSYFYQCYNGTFSMTIPGSNMTENFHKTKWRCVDLVSLNASNETVLYVNVPVKTITISASDDTDNFVNIPNGHNETFNCTTNPGRPPARIQWYLSDLNLTANATTKSIHLANEKWISSSVLIYTGKLAQNNKNMTCTAVNIEGREEVLSQNKTIIINYGPSRVNLSPANQSYSIIENDSIDPINCSADCFPACTVRWKKLSLSVSDFNVLNIQHINRSQAGNYSCVAANRVSAISVTIIIIVIYAPDVDPSIIQTPGTPIDTGNNVTLTCTVSGGYPLAILFWDCNGTFTQKTLENAISYLVHFTVDKFDNNRICTCSAKHPVDSYRPKVQHTLIVYYPPDNDLSIQQTPSGAIITGKNIILTCKLSGGNPLAILLWNCNGTTSSNTSGNTTSNSVEFTVDKTYNNSTCTCSASHIITSYKASVQHKLVIFFPPDVRVVNKSDTLENQTLELICEALGNPTNYSYQWVHSFDDKTLRNFSGNTDIPRPNFQIKSLSYEDAGRYTCTVSNGIEKNLNILNNSASIYIDVKFKPVFLNFDKEKTAKSGGNITLTAEIYTYPDVTEEIQWFNETDNTSLTNSSDLLITSQTTTSTTIFHGINVFVNKYVYRTTMKIHRFSPLQAGNYIIRASNPSGSSSKKILLILSDVPLPPVEFSASIIGARYVLLSWLAGFNGGNPQVFKITYEKLGTTENISININESLITKQHQANIQNLHPATEYVFYISASNIEGNAVGTNNSLIIQTLSESDHFSSILGPVGGAVGGLVFAAIITTIILLVRKSKGHKKRQSDGKPLHLSSTEEEYTGELKDNILYVSSGDGLPTAKCSDEASCDLDPSKDIILSAKKDSQETRLYAEVNKKHHLKDVPGKFGKQSGSNNKEKHAEINNYESNNDVYENVAINKTKNENEKNKVNKDGLIYAELVFKDTEKKQRKFVIHGVENKTNYADIDLTLKADPLPSDESDKEETKEDNVEA